MPARAAAEPPRDGATAAAPPDGGEGDRPGTLPAEVAGLPFDAALAELQAVVARLEGGGLALEDSIALYERGVALHEHCARLLGDAELRVQRLVERSGGALRTIDLRPGDDEDP
ncbi:MAG: exodeoxyribonuclease VII small subunit [Chloroflexota bacterium]|nr:MAG: exodeoxyribonuclease VII small subunit [Chloroflexota bacterium]